MEKIASFTINHDLLTPGMYVSRVDGDAVTYDLRLKYPNRGAYLAIALTRDAFAFAAAFTGEIPGANAVECGKYLEHDLPGARTEAAGYVEVLQGWTAEKMVYPA